MNKFLKYIPLLPLLALGCTKAPDVEGEAVPVFNISGVTNAGAYSLQGGVDSVYLFTDFKIDSAGFYHLKGIFSNAACPSFECPGTLAFTFKIKKDQPLPNGSNLPFLNVTLPNAEFETLTITPTDTSNQDFTINVGPETSINTPANVNVFNNEPKEISISSLNKTNLVKSTGALHYLPAYPDSCKAVRLYAKVESNEVSLQAEIAGHNLNYTWNNGATNVTAVTMPYDKDQTYAITVTSPDAGCTAAASLSNLPENTGNTFIKAASFSVTNSGFMSGTAQTGIMVEWVNAAGIRFSSANSGQQGSSFFTVSTVEPYKVNEKGQSTIRISIKFQCLMVASGASGLEPFTMTGNGVIGVAQPD